jgi:hypothetical protein
MRAFNLPLNEGEEIFFYYYIQVLIFILKSDMIKYNKEYFSN